MQFTIGQQLCIVTPKNSLELTKHMTSQHSTRGHVKTKHKGEAAFNELRPQRNGCNARWAIVLIFHEIEIERERERKRERNKEIERQRKWVCEQLALTAVSLRISLLSLSRKMGRQLVSSACRLSPAIKEIMKQDKKVSFPPSIKLNVLCNN